MTSDILGGRSHSLDGLVDKMSLMSISIKRAQSVSNLPGRAFALMIQGFLLYTQDQDFWQPCQHVKSLLIEQTAKVESANPLIEVYIVGLPSCFVRPLFPVRDWLQHYLQDEQQGKSVSVFSCAKAFSSFPNFPNCWSSRHSVTCNMQHVAVLVDYNKIFELWDRGCHITCR